MAELGPWTALYLVAAGLDLLLAGVLLRHRRREGALPLAVFLVGVAVAAVGQGLARGATDVSGAALWFQVGLVGTAFVPVGWIYFGIEYAGREAWSGRRTVAVLAVEPAVLLALVLVPGAAEGLVYSVEATGAAPVDRIGLGPATLVHFVYYMLGLVFGSVLFLALFVRARHLYRGQAAALLFGASIPWLGHLLSLSDVVTDVRLTPFLLTLAGASMTLAVYRFKLMDPVPVAHESVFEEMADGVVVLDENDRIGKANPAALSLLAPREDDDVRGRPIGAVLPAWDGLDGDRLRDEWQELTLERGERTRHVELQVSPFRDRNGELVGRLVHLRDVTARKRREQLLARFKTIFESVNDRVFVLDEDDRFLLVNEPMADLVGVDPGDLEGRPFRSILADDRTGLPDVDDGETIEVTVHRDGRSIPCEARLAPVEFDPEVAGVVGVLRDVSRRKRTERTLAETSERLETLVDASPLAILSIDEEGTVESWNPAAESIFGWTAEEARGNPPPMIPEPDAEELAAIHERVLDGERFTDLELELVRADGSRMDASVSVAPVADRSGEIRGSVAVIADVTERKERERTLRRQNERLEEFAGIVSHDLRNPLQVARGTLEMLDTDDRRARDRIDTALDRMEELIDDLLTIAREGRAIDPEELDPVSLRRVATEAWQTVDTGESTLRVEDDVGVVLADPTRFREILENLFRNSVEHGSTGSRPGTDDSVEHAGVANDGSTTVRIGLLDDGAGFFVADDGPGIPEERREEIFESGFTTDDDGVGLGLSIVSNLAEAHGWDVVATEAETGGARFEFRGVERPRSERTVDEA